MTNKLHEYDAKVDTIKIRHITPNRRNARILRRLKSNVPSLSTLFVNDRHTVLEEAYFPDSDHPDDYDGISWLGYFIGRNVHLKEMLFSGNVIAPRLGSDADDTIESFCRGFNQNSTIERIAFTNGCSDTIGRMSPFLQNNQNLTHLVILNSELGQGGAKSLSLAKSLKSLCLSNNGMGRETLSELCLSLRKLPDIQKLSLPRNNVGRNKCIDLAASLYNMTRLDTLELYETNIDDEGIETLIPALACFETLDELNLSGNPDITVKGYKTISNLLKKPRCNMKHLNLGINTKEAWEVFSTLLCDTSTVSNTYLSNHKVVSLLSSPHHHPSCVSSNLKLNRIADKQKVAMIKVLHHHQKFDMQPLLEWDFKALPSVIQKLDTAIWCVEESDPSGGIALPNVDGIKSRKLDLIYQFIGGMPMMYIGCQRLESKLKEAAARATEKRRSSMQEREHIEQRKIRHT